MRRRPSLGSSTVASQSLSALGSCSISFTGLAFPCLRRALCPTELGQTSRYLLRRKRFRLSDGSNRGGEPVMGARIPYPFGELGRGKRRLGARVIQRAVGRVVETRAECRREPVAGLTGEQHPLCSLALGLALAGTEGSSGLSPTLERLVRARLPTARLHLLLRIAHANTLAQSTTPVTTVTGARAHWACQLACAGVSVLRLAALAPSLTSTSRSLPSGKHTSRSGTPHPTAARLCTRQPMARSRPTMAAWLASTLAARLIPHTRGIAASRAPGAALTRD